MNSIKILITGDFCPNLRLENLDANSDGKKVIGGISELIATVDIAVTNLECPITNHTIPIEKTGPALKGAAGALDFLASSGFNLVTLANNHIMDFGDVGLQDTIKNLDERNIAYVGAGLNDTEASKPFIFQKSVVSVGIINVAENEWSTTLGSYPGANPIEPIGVFNQIMDLKEKVNHIILITHGGHEMYELPSPRMKKWFRSFIDMGADAVINHHTHCISGNEVYKGKPIYYSIGNFLFDREQKEPSIWNLGQAVVLDLEGSSVKACSYYFDQCSKDPVIEFYQDHSKIKENVTSLNKVIQDNIELEKAFDNYCKSKSRVFKSYLEPYNSKLLIPLMNRGIIPSIWASRKKILLENLVRCEAHRDVLLKYLKRENRDS